MIKITIVTLGGEQRYILRDKESANKFLDEQRDNYIKDVNELGTEYLSVLRGEDTMSLFSSHGIKIFKCEEV